MLPLQCGLGSTPVDVRLARHSLSPDLFKSTRLPPYQVHALAVVRLSSNVGLPGKNMFLSPRQTGHRLAGRSSTRDVISMAKKGKRKTNGEGQQENEWVFGIVEDTATPNAASPSVDQAAVERALGSVPVSDLAVAARVDAALWAREEARWQREASRWEREERRWEREREAFEKERESWAQTKAELLAEVAALKEQVGGIPRGTPATSPAAVTPASGPTASSAVGSSPRAAPPTTTPPTPPPVPKEKQAPVPSPAPAAPVQGKTPPVEAAKPAPPPAAPPPAGAPTMPRLRNGASGDVVEILHKMLENQGFYPGEEEMEYALFLEGTESAVKTFQCTHKLKEDGIVGPKTWAVLLTLEGIPDEFADIASTLSSSSPSAAPSAPAPVSTSSPSTPAASSAPPSASSSWGGGKASATPESERYARTETQAGSSSGSVRVFLLGENRWEEPGRTSVGPISLEPKAGDKGSKGLKLVAACFTCRGVGAMMCTAAQLLCRGRPGLYVLRWHGLGKVRRLQWDWQGRRVSFLQSIACTERLLLSGEFYLASAHHSSRGSHRSFMEPSTLMSA
eukprot:jgi/Mesvir1/6453/Mv19533-RA.1